MTEKKNKYVKIWLIFNPEPGLKLNCNWNKTFKVYRSLTFLVRPVRATYLLKKLSVQPKRKLFKLKLKSTLRSESTPQGLWNWNSTIWDVNPSLVKKKSQQGLERQVNPPGRSQVSHPKGNQVLLGEKVNNLCFLNMPSFPFKRSQTF